MTLSELRRLKGPEAENPELKRLLADTMPDNAGLKGLLAKTPDARRAVVSTLMTEHQFTQRRACRLVGIPRSSLACQAHPDRHARLRERLATLSGKHRRYGYRIAACQAGARAEIRGYPDILVVGNGSELRRPALDAWAGDHGVQLYFIDPGKPAQNAYIESFNGRFRDECLNQHWFTSIGEARKIIEEWRVGYNTERPRSSLKYQTPEEFAAARPFDKTQWAPPLELLEGSAPIAHTAE